MGLPTKPDGYLLGVDISFNQGIVDHDALVEAGVDFEILRATDGIHDTDSQFSRNLQGAVDAGIDFALYFVLEPYPLTVVRAQVDNFVARAKDCGSTIPHWLDWELAKGETGLAAIQSAAEACEEVEQLLGQRVMVYGGPAFIRGLEKLAGPAAQPFLDELVKRPIALAHYGCAFGKPSIPPPWTSFAIHQAGPINIALPGSAVRVNATLPGRQTPVDVDWFKGSIDDLRALTSL